MIQTFLVVVALAIAAAEVGAQESAAGLNLALPTDNDALFKGGGAEFYQYIIRDFKGVTTKPWQGGQYGFVRNPVQTPRGLVYTRFHEGMDIRPVRRDARGEPLDEVRAIADGTVIYTNLVPSRSNYGNYVVVEHRWDGANYYSLYGHLASIGVERGTKVQRGQQLGVMGYTGEGLDRERAHLHLELNLLLSRQFDGWYGTYMKTEPNYHGLYSGLNLTAVDIARLYRESRKRPSLTISEFLSDEERFFSVKFPRSKNFDLVRRYPWLSRGSADAAAWEISFNRAGVPLKAEPAEETVSAPTLSYVKKRAGDYAGQTRGVIGGSGDAPRLTESGQRLMRLFIFPD